MAIKINQKITEEYEMKNFLRITSIALIFALLIQVLPMSMIADAIGKTSAGTTATQEESPIIGEVKLSRQVHKSLPKRRRDINAVVSSTPIHFQDNKEWADIDNTLIVAPSTARQF